MATHHLSRALLVAVVAALALAAPANAAAPTLVEEVDAYVLDNGHVTVRFEGKLPSLRLAPSLPTGGLAELPDTGAQAGYGYRFVEVVEYRDLDGDGAPTQGEAVARLDLSKATAWKVERVETEDMVVLNYSLTAPVRLAGRAAAHELLDNVTLPAEGEAHVSLVFTLRAQDALLNETGFEISVPASALKYDFLVHQWPAVDLDAHRLALVTSIEGALEVEEVVDAAGRAAIMADGLQVGTFGWTTVAQGIDAAGEAVEVPVKTELEAGADNMTRISFTYDAAGLAGLRHDPTLGVATVASIAGASTDAGAKVTEVPAPGLGLVAGAGLVAAAAYGMRRRHR